MFRMILNQYSLCNTRSVEAVSSSSRNDLLRFSCRVSTCSCALRPNRCSSCEELHGGRRPQAHLSACIRSRNLLNLNIAGICPGASKCILRFLPVSSFLSALVMNISRSASGEVFSWTIFESYSMVSSCSIAFASCFNQ